MGRRPKQTFLQRKHTDGQQEKEKMLNITNYQRKANQNYEVVPHTSQNDHHQKVYQKKKKMLGVEEKKPFNTVAGNVIWYSHYGEKYGASLKS